MAPETVSPGSNYPNKALAAAITTVVGAGVQWLTTGELESRQEGVTALVGAATTLLVYLVSNARRLFRSSWSRSS